MVDRACNQSEQTGRHPAVRPLHVQGLVGLHLQGSCHMDPSGYVYSGFTLKKYLQRIKITVENARLVHGAVCNLELQPSTISAAYLGQYPVLPCLPRV